MSRPNVRPPRRRRPDRETAAAVKRVSKGEAGGDGGGSGGRTPPPADERTSPLEFAREVRSEIRKVSWPTRAEVINYSLVVFFTVIVLTALIGSLDWLFSISILELFKP